MFFLLWALGPWLLALPILAPIYAVRWVVREGKRAKTAGSLALKVAWGVFRFGMQRKPADPDQGPVTAREPAVARGNYRWEAVLDDHMQTFRERGITVDRERVEQIRKGLTSGPERA